MTEAVSCENCGKPIAANAPSGFCPGCLLRTAIEHGAGRTLAPLLPRLRYFGDYELLEEIARGGMGVVYRARQVSLDRVVAVKMMRPGVLATGDEIRRFQTEARTAAGMQHPNIVAIHEVGELDGLHYFSMDFVEGPSLAELVRQGPLEPKEAAQYVRALAEAVRYAHGKGILHRDLKPSNVLVDAGGRPRVTDFGLARPMEGSAGMTVTGTLIGTPAYMPPEQASGQGGPLSPAADCYSLGAILYELLTGVPPFRGANPLAIVRMVLEEEPARPRSLDPNISRDLEAICLRCLEKDPARRYQSAADLAGDLDRYLRGEAVQVRRARLRLRRWHVAAAAALILAVIVWAVARNEPRARQIAAKPRTATSPALPGILVMKTLPAPAAIAAVKKGAIQSIARKPAPAPAPAPPPPPSGPVGISVDPDGGSGSRQIFTFRYSEPEGVAPIAAVEVEFRDSASDRSCRLFVEPDGDHVALQTNPLRGPGLRQGGHLGEFGELENAVCSVDLSGVIFSHRNHTLEIGIPIAFKPSFAGAKEIHSWPLDARTRLRLPSGIKGEWR